MTNLELNKAIASAMRQCLTYCELSGHQNKSMLHDSIRREFNHLLDRVNGKGAK